MNMIKRLLKDETAATAIEYGLIAALVSVASISAMGSLGNALSNSFNTVSNKMASAQTGKI